MSKFISSFFFMCDEGLAQMMAQCNLILVSLLEKAGSREFRQLAKVQGAGLLRSLFGGQVVVERNFPEPVFAL